MEPVKRQRYKDIKHIRQRMKEYTILAMGGECQICGYKRCKAALEFHHINPEEKEFSFKSIKGWEVLYAELEKCILLCALCHREIHYGVAVLPKTYARFDAALVDQLRKDHLVEAVKRPKRT